MPNIPDAAAGSGRDGAGVDRRAAGAAGAAASRLAGAGAGSRKGGR